jgi:hypothetical protein
MYDKYYEECQPALCIYSLATKNNGVYIVITLTTLVGGLVNDVQTFSITIGQLHSIPHLKTKKKGRSGTVGHSNLSTAMSTTFISNIENSLYVR